MIEKCSQLFNLLDLSIMTGIEFKERANETLFLSFILSRSLSLYLFSYLNSKLYLPSHGVPEGREPEAMFDEESASSTQKGKTSSSSSGSSSTISGMKK